MRGGGRRGARRVRALLGTWAMSVAGACGEPAAAPQPGARATATVRNALDVEVAISAGSTPLGVLPPGGGTAVELPPHATRLEWRSRKRPGTAGAALADDLEGGGFPLGAAGSPLEVTNVVSGITYVTPVIASALADTVALELVQGDARRCLGWQQGVNPAGMAWGYYRLETSMQLRVYRGTRCAGESLAWTAAQLGAFVPRTGRVLLVVDRLP